MTDAATPRPDWAAARALFDRLADLPAPERAAALRAEPDAALQREVRQLLAQHDAAATFLEAPARRAEAGPPDRRGQRLGPWALSHALGAGGMGEVWAAQRADGAYEGKAAVKLLKRGMDSAAVLHRFALERQALARLAHPHIARLMDAGASADGQPFFVMELVDGRPWPEAVRALGLAARLRLFLQLADAVAHAHRHLLVHRDLKPGNVLVDGDGQVKLLDFGIAKVLDPLEGHDGDSTVSGTRPYTPNYASPEQIRGEPVGTATDVYSLGVLLYELLTGVRPTGREAATTADAVRAALEEEPLRPSRLDSLQAKQPDWPRWRRALEGDLDHIALKALAKDPGQRYPSVDALAADIQAWLDGRPVSARAASPGYVLAKFLRRNRGAALAAGLGGAGLLIEAGATLLRGQVAAVAGVAGLAAGLGAALWQARRAEQARERAEKQVAELRKLTNRVVFDYHDGIQALPGATPVRERMLGDTAEYLRKLEPAARDDPRLALELALIAGRIAQLQGATFGQGLEQIGRAEASFEQALRLVELACGPQLQDADALYDCAVILVDAAEFDQRLGRLAPTAGDDGGAIPRRAALQTLERAGRLVERAALAQPGHPHLPLHRATIQGRIGRLLGYNVTELSLGRWREARPHLEAAVRHMRELLAQDTADAEWHRQLAWALAGLAAWHRLAGEPALALATTREAVAAIDTACCLAPDHAVYRQFASVMPTHLAMSLAIGGDADGALAHFREAIARNEAMGAADPANAVLRRDRAFMQVSTGRLLLDAGRLAEAAVPLGEAHATLAALPAASDDFYLARWRAEAAAALALAESASHPARARGLAEEALALLVPAEASGATLHALRVVQAQAEGAAALACQAQGDVAAAQRHVQRAFAHWAWFERDGEPLPRQLAQRRDALRRDLAGS